MNWGAGKQSSFSVAPPEGCVRRPPYEGNFMTIDRHFKSKKWSVMATLSLSSDDLARFDPNAQPGSSKALTPAKPVPEVSSPGAVVQ
ncbi:MAG: hypothetical protein ABSF90_23305 [Syntrophobacteraceae bacterium]|jgi:hypothetical protein